MSNIVPFDFEGSSIRIQQDDSGDPWFNANDVCVVLDFGNPRQALDSHVEPDDVQKLDTIDRMGRGQSANFVNESGLYALILGSTKPEAKRFKRWVTSEVLPSISKTGLYAAPGATPSGATPVGADVSDLQRILFSKQSGLVSPEEARLATLKALGLDAPALALPAPIKPAVKRKPAPKPIKILKTPHGGFDGWNFLVDEIAEYVVGGAKEVKRAMLEFGLINEAGGPTSKGRGLVYGKSPSGYRWKVGALLRFLSGQSV